jgi:hypothetical protein
MITKIQLSDKYQIYRSHDSNFINIKEDCLKFVKLNELMVFYSNYPKKTAPPNSVWMEIQADCFLGINDIIKKYIKEISGKTFKNYAEHYWIYTQTKGFNLEWMHQHLLVHPQGRSNIKTDYTFTYYIQTPKDINGDEGHIVFETEDKNRHKFLPEEGDIFIFPADIRHTAMPTPNSEIDRIVYAGNLCLNVEQQDMSDELIKLI